MKKFLEEFKAFALKGNMIDLARYDHWQCIYINR